MGMLIRFVIIIAMIIAFVLYMQKRDEKKKEAEMKAEQDAIRERSRKRALKEAAYQASIVGDNDTVQAIKNGTYSGPLPTYRNGQAYTSIYDHLLILPIAGINYRTGIKAYVGKFKGVLVPQPNNEYDQNAIMIKCEDGHHLGFVPEDKTVCVRQVIGSDFKSHRIVGEIFKYDDTDDDGKPRTYFAGHIYITPHKM